MKQAIEKLEIELLFSQRCQHSWLKRPFSLRNKISNSYSKGFVHKTKRERIEKTVFPYGNRIYIQSCLLKGWEWRWFLRKVRDLKTSLRRRVAKCRGSWVLVWVNVVGKKTFSKKRNLNRKSCKINETKISAYILVLFSFPVVSKAGKQANPLVQTVTTVQSRLNLKGWAKRDLKLPYERLL